MKSLLIFSLFLLASCSTQKEGCACYNLFDGETLNGWNALPGGTWKVVHGSIAGFSEKSEKRHGILLTDKEYSDFVMCLKYKSLKGNSGLYFRVQKVDHAVSVKGFQAEIDVNGKNQGGLYETLGRAYVAKVSPEKVKTFYKKHQWNEMKVRAVGGDITVWVNGVKTAELKDDPGNRKGFIGLQLHGGQDMEIYFKDICIEDLSDKK